MALTMAWVPAIMMAVMLTTAMMTQADANNVGNEVHNEALEVYGYMWCELCR